ncbi:MAG: hypothetical protein ACFFDI_14685 [Promethearchaeota archaeon]
MTETIDEEHRGNGFSNPNSPFNSSSEETERNIADRLAVGRITNPDCYIGRPQRWYLGSTFRTLPGEKNYRRLWNLQRDTLYNCQGKRLNLEQVIGALSEFFPIPIIDDAVQILLFLEGKLPAEDSLIVHILAAIESILRLRQLLITNKTLDDINRKLALRITKREVNKARFQICQKFPRVRPRDPHKCTNQIMQRLASQIVMDYTFDPSEKRWAVKETIRLAKEMLNTQFYPSCPEVYGYALAILVVNTLNKAKRRPRCRIHSKDPAFRKKVSMAMFRLKKRFDLNGLLDNYHLTCSKL